MKRTRHGFSVRIALLCAWIAPWALRAQETPGTLLAPNTLTQAVQILKLSSAEAGRNLSVQLRGVVTFFEQRTELCFVQDETAGIYVYLKNWDRAVKAGNVVEVTGTTGAGAYSPLVNRGDLKATGSGRLPAPKPLAIEQLAAGREDCQWVQLEGVVHRVTENWGHLVLDLVAGSSSVKVRVLEREPAQVNSLVDSMIRVQGVAAASYDTRKQLGGFYLLSPSTQQVTVLERGSDDPFTGPIRTGRGLKAYSPGLGLDHRVRLRGIVTLHWPKNILYIRDDSGGVRVQCDREERVEIGEIVDVAGFPVLGAQAPAVSDAIFRKATRGEVPSPVTTAPSQAFSGAFDNELVKMEAWLVAAESAGDDGQIFFLRAEKTGFHARLQKSQGEVRASRLLPGSKVQITGICAREATEGGVASVFNLLLRSPHDIRLLELPPHSKMGTVDWILWGLALALGLGLGWVALLGKRVEQRAAVLRRREVSLEERQNEKEQRKTLEERERIARDLHDSIIQSIYAVGLNLEDCKRLVNEKPADVERQLAKVLADLNGVIRDVRNFILGLESDTLKGEEFKTALKSIVLTLGEARAPCFTLQIDPQAAEDLTSHQATQLLHVAREAVSNSVRHAQAERTVLCLQPHNGRIRFEVRDNGMGFDPAAVGAGGHGLRNMAVRARELGAVFSVVSEIGQGTRIVLDIPVKNSHQSA